MRYLYLYRNILVGKTTEFAKVIMMNNPAQIVHESETQRQFVRLQLPAMAEINGNRFTVKDLSSGGMAIRDIKGSAKKGDIINISLMLPFADFSLDIDLKAEIQHIDKKTDVAGCRFIDLNANQVSILNHVIKSFMAGDVVGTNDIINVVSRENFVNVRQHANNNAVSFFDKVKRYSIYGFVMLATLALAFFIVNNIIEKLYIIKTPHGQVTARMVDILSPHSGIFTSTTFAGVRSVKTGQIIARIKSPDSNTVSIGGNSSDNFSITNIISPCDCFITERFALNGEYKPQDTPVFKLLPQNSDILITAKVDIDDVHRLDIGTKATIHISGISSISTGSITDIKINEQTTTEEKPTALVTIRPDKKLSNDAIDRPAFLEFHL